jgi:hypothetical protein
LLLPVEEDGGDGSQEAGNIENINM